MPTLVEGDDARVLAAVERIVLALDVVHEEHDQCVLATGEREQLRAYIDASITERGNDVDALTARHGLGRMNSRTSAATGRQCPRFGPATVSACPR